MFLSFNFDIDGHTHSAAQSYRGAVLHYFISELANGVASLSVSLADGPVIVNATYPDVLAAKQKAEQFAGDIAFGECDGLLAGHIAQPSSLMED